MEKKNRYTRKLSDYIPSDTQNTDEKMPAESLRLQKSLKKPEDEKSKEQERNQTTALKQMLKCAPQSIGKADLTPEEKSYINKKYIASFEEKHKKELYECEVFQNMGFGKSRGKDGGPKNRSYKRGNISESSILNRFNIEDWVEIVCKYYRALPMLIKLENLELKGRVKTSPKMTSNGVSAIKQLEKILDVQDRKQQYLNMYALNKQFENLCIDKNEMGVFKILFQHCESIREKYGTRARSAYRIKTKMMARFVNYCTLKGYTAPWFCSHFGQLPMVTHEVNLLMSESGRGGRRLGCLL